MVFLIAILPALMVYIVAAITHSKGSTTVAAVIAAAVGLGTGNPDYMVLDVVCVGVVYWFSLSSILGMSGRQSDSKKLTVREDEEASLLVGVEHSTSRSSSENVADEVAKKGEINNLLEIEKIQRQKKSEEQTDLLNQIMRDREELRLALQDSKRKEQVAALGRASEVEDAKNLEKMARWTRK